MIGARHLKGAPGSSRKVERPSGPQHRQPSSGPNFCFKDTLLQHTSSKTIKDTPPPRTMEIQELKNLPILSNTEYNRLINLLTEFILAYHLTNQAGNIFHKEFLLSSW